MKTLLRNTLLLLLAFWANLGALYGQQARLYTAEEGLVNSLINAIYQDSRGYIWVATENGLAYFDGMHFTAFHPANDPESLASNLVLTVFEDSRHTLWVGSSAPPQRGLQRFDYESNTFHTLRLASAEERADGMHVAAIVESPDRRELIVATSGRGLFVLRMEDYSHDAARSDALNRLLPSRYIRDMKFDHRGRLWVVSEESNLSVIAYPDNRLVDIAWSPTIQPSSAIINAIAPVERADKVLLGTMGEGLLLFDEEQMMVRRPRGEGLDEKFVVSLLTTIDPSFVGEDAVLVGTEMGGVCAFDLTSESLKPFRVANSRFDLSEGKVHALASDNQGNVWVGCYQRGLVVLPKPMYGFDYVEFFDSEERAVSPACVTSVLVGRDGVLWVGTDGAGLYALHKDGSRRHYTAENSLLPNNAVMTLTEDKHGTIWISTYLGGMVCRTPHGGLSRVAALENPLVACVMNTTYDRERDRLYLGTYGDGVQLLDLQSMHLETVREQELPKWIGSLYIDRQGLLWVGSFNGLKCYDTQNRRLLNYAVGEVASTSRIYALAESASTGILWIGSGEGLVSFDRSTGLSRRYTTSDGLPANVINAIAESDEGTLWISTGNGLSRLSPEQHQFKNFYAADGLQGNEFRYGAMTAAADGRLFFGGTNGLTAFYPHIVDQGLHPVPPINFSSLRVLNKEVQYDPDSENNILDKHISQATTLTLEKYQNVFDLEFSVQEYTNPRRIIYAYRMEGFDTDWNYTDSRNRVATYTNLPDGRYTFRLRAFFEGEEQQGAVERTLRIRILPPWWKSGWAYLLYVVVLALGVGAVWVLYRRHRGRLEERAESELKDLKLQMFTDFSHEIRTPLTLVIAPLRQLRAEETDTRHRELYNLMYRNSLRIQRLVNQLMDIRKIDNGRMQLNCFKSDLVFFVRDIMHSFDHAANTKHIAFTLECPHESLEVWIDQSNFDKVLFNILSNAFKFTPEHGRVTLRLSTHANDRRSGVELASESYVELQVENSGSRIEPRLLEHVFDRFFQVEARNHIGSGIGLHLAKKLIELHRGAIFASNTDEGVCFTVRLPLGNAHLSSDEMLAAAKHKDLYMNLRAQQPAEAVAGLDYRAEEQPAEGRISKSKRNVVLVDDDQELGAYLRSELQQLYNVEYFPNGKDAWRHISSSIPDAVVTDLVMPEMDGLELCRKIKQSLSTNHIPVVVLTSQSDDESLQQCIEMGADRFLTKPINLELLRSGIAQAIATREMIRNKFRTEVDGGYTEVEMGSSDDKLVNRVVEVIRKHIEDPDFSVDDLSREVGLSRVHLNRKLKEHISTSPSNLIRSIRLKQAAFLLINHKVNISEVAYKVGFSTHSYFSNSFRDYFGMTPKEFVAKYMNCTDEETLKRLFNL